MNTDASAFVRLRRGKQGAVPCAIYPSTLGEAGGGNSVGDKWLIANDLQKTLTLTDLKRWRREAETVLSELL